MSPVTLLINVLA